jgi:hypothetical protein
MPNDTITIFQSQYDQFVRDSKKLAALEAAGVDNWEGYGEALSELYQEEDCHG